MIIGIDATTIGSGGGINHLKNFLNFSSKKFRSNIYILFLKKGNQIEYKFRRNVKIEILDSSFIVNIFLLDKKLKENKCDLLFSPAGFYFGRFKPQISMSQNLLPFNKYEVRRFDILYRLKFKALGMLQKKTFKKSDGVIFLSDFAKNIISKRVKINKRIVIPHGKEFFNFEFKFKTSKKIKFLYVSDFWPYKNHLFLIDLLIKFSDYSDFEIDLIGNCPLNYKVQIENKIENKNNIRQKIKIHGSLPHSKIPEFYKNADVVIFPSSCENLPIAVIEAMSFGKPIITLDQGPMNEMIYSNNLYLDIDDLSYSVRVLRQFCHLDNLKKCSLKNLERSKKYDWDKNAIETNNFFKKIINIQ